MSAIGLLPRPKAKNLISSHANYRREDFMFPRTQSCALRDRPWEHRSQPLKSWDRLVYGGILVAAVAIAMLALLR